MSVWYKIDILSKYKYVKNHLLFGMQIIINIWKLYLKCNTNMCQSWTVGAKILLYRTCCKAVITLNALIFITGIPHIIVFSHRFVDLNRVKSNEQTKYSSLHEICLPKNLFHDFFLFKYYYYQNVKSKILVLHSHFYRYHLTNVTEFFCQLFFYGSPQHLLDLR